MLKSICFFTPYGHTFTFRDTTILVDNETVIVVAYKAMSDGKQKKVTVLKKNIVGYSIQT